MKTAMQELIEWMQEGLGNGTKTIGNILEKSKELLEKEKEQIIEFADRYADDVMGGCLLRAKEYYETHAQDTPATYTKRESTTVEDIRNITKEIEKKSNVG